MDALRPYQQDAVEAVLASAPAHVVVEMPTGAGKSLVLAALAAQHPGRVLVVTHRKELLVQNASKLPENPGANGAGFYSAGLRQRCTDARMVFGGLQSIWRHMDDLQRAGRFTLLLVDEAHRVDIEAKMYGTVFSACRDARRVGLSATPYRLGQGPIYGEGQPFDRLVYRASIRDLTPEYLTPLVGLQGVAESDTRGLPIAQGEFVRGALAQVACDEELIARATDEMVSLGKDRRAWCVFCVSVAHTERVAQALEARGIRCAVLLGSTPDAARDQIVADFRAGERYRALVNCQVACEGFDFPGIDLVSMLASTMSRRLVIQQIGRGSRQAPGKRDCLILDYAGNIARHAPLDEAFVQMGGTPQRVAAEAKKRQGIQQARQRQLRHGVRASTASLWEAPAREQVTVQRLQFQVVPAKSEPGKQNLMVTYHVKEPHIRQVKRWLCPEYASGARWFAEQWFARRGLVMPRNAHDAMALAKKTPIVPEALLIDRQDTGYWQVVVEMFPASGAEE